MRTGIAIVTVSLIVAAPLALARGGGGHGGGGHGGGHGGHGSHGAARATGVTAAPTKGAMAGAGVRRHGGGGGCSDRPEECKRP